MLCSQAQIGEEEDNKNEKTRRKGKQFFPLKITKDLQPKTHSNNDSVN